MINNTYCGGEKNPVRFTRFKPCKNGLGDVGMASLLIAPSGDKPLGIVVDWGERHWVEVRNYTNDHIETFKPGERAKAKRWLVNDLLSGFAYAWHNHIGGGYSE